MTDPTPFDATLDDATLPPAQATALRDLVNEKVAGRWDQWAQAHPNLAQVVDRTRLVDGLVDELQRHPDFAEALRQADEDDTCLTRAAEVVQFVERWVVKLLAI